MAADRSQPHHTATLFVEALPATTKTAFKVACVKNGTTMRDAIVGLMREYIAKSE